MPNRLIQVFSSQAALAQALARRIALHMTQAVATRGQFHWVLSGGGTPRPLYRVLATPPHRGSLPWGQTHFYWGDERCVPPDHPESNYGQAREILLEPAAVPAANVHRIRGELEPVEAAADYARCLKRLAEPDLEWPRFDLVLLGMGRDGHTASLFPGVMTDEESKAPVRAVTAYYDGRPAERVTLTPPVFNSALNIWFLVTGADKADTVAAVIDGPVDLRRWPAQRIEPEDGSVTFMLDEAAAKKITAY